MDRTTADHFASEWAEHWNSHDLDGLIGPLLTTSCGLRRWRHGSSKAATACCGERRRCGPITPEGLRLTPELHFEVLGVYQGVTTMVINYRNQRGALVNEVLNFDDAGLVREGHGTYLGGGASTATGR